MRLPISAWNCASLFFWYGLCDSLNVGDSGLAGFSTLFFCTYTYSNSIALQPVAAGKTGTNLSSHYAKKEMPMQENLYFRIHGELYVVDISSAMYFKADDHYTHVYYASGTHFMIPFGLTKVELAIDRHENAAARFLRLGRTYIVDINRIFHVNAIKQVALLADNHGQHHSIRLPKAVLHSLIDRLGSDKAAPLPPTD